MMIAIWPLVIAVVGAFLYGWNGHELSRLTFFVGMIWLVFSMIGQKVALGSTAVAVWPFVWAVAGALVYVLTKDNQKVKELARITFFVGLGWLVYTLVGHTLKLNP